MKKLLLIDGFSLLFRAFYAMPLTMTSPDGVHTNAVYGFLTILNKVIEEEAPSHLAVAFDRPEPTFRHEMYAEYKGNRAAAPEEFHEQVPVLRDVLDAMQIPVLSVPGFEADDIMGTLAKKGSAASVPVVIVSGDRDLLQTASELVSIVIPKTYAGKTTYERYDPARVMADFGVTPEAFIELKALMGDSSDNVPGLPGVGPKTAEKILAAFGTIENARAHIDEIKPKKAMEAMRDHGDLLDLSKELVTIRTDAPVAFSEDLQVRDIYNEKAIDAFRSLGFRSLVNKYGAPLTESAWESADESVLPEEFLTETAADTGAETPAAGSDAETPVRELPDSGRRAVINAKEYLKKEYPDGFVPIDAAEELFDVTIAAYLIDPLRSDWDYDTIAAGYLGRILPGRKETEKAFSPEEAAAKIAAYEEETANAAMPYLLARLREEGMEELFYQVEMPLTAVLAGMENAGILCSREELARYGQDLAAHIAELEEAIYEEAGEKFNLNSPKQLSAILFEKMQIPGGKKTKTGYSTAADVLEKLAPEHPVIANILEYRTYAKLKSTYADGLPAFIAEDGRIHTHFNQTVTATGRLSSNEPNLQNIPMRMELGRLIRKSFYPKEGCVFVDADYSQIELRILAHMSGDEKLIEAYHTAKDIHRMTASQVFHVPFEEVTDEMRRNAKAVNFGIVYGISSFGLSQGLSITPKEASEYIEKYFASYPKIKAFLDGQVASAKEKGYAVSLFGRRRPVPELKESNFMRRSFGERVAMNAPIQGTAADIMKIAMIRTERRLRAEGLQARVILQIHDELLVEAPEEEAVKVRDILSEEMPLAADLSVPLLADAHIGKDWYEAK